MPPDRLHDKSAHSLHRVTKAREKRDGAIGKRRIRTSIPPPSARVSEWLHLETPSEGGHVGFVAFNDEGEYWSERRAGEFLKAAAVG
jgi:hypothetical protein